MQLDQSLDAWEEKVARTRRRILIAGAIYVGGFVACWCFAWTWRTAAPNAAAGTMRPLVLLPLVIAALTAAITGIWLAGLYVFKYGPRLSRARFDAQTSMMLELQQQMKQLQEKLERQDQ